MFLFTIMKVRLQEEKTLRGKERGGSSGLNRWGESVWVKFETKTQSIVTVGGGKRAKGGETAVQEKGKNKRKPPFSGDR